MDNFVLRKKRRFETTADSTTSKTIRTIHVPIESENDSTDLKIATLASLFPEIDQTALLEMLINLEGSVQQVSEALSFPADSSPKRKSGNAIGVQTSLASFKQDIKRSSSGSVSVPLKAKTRKGQTLHLYTSEDIEMHTPCSIIHNFLSSNVAEELLRELLGEATTFERQTFKMFDNVVQSPHSACFYVENLEERERQQTEYLYNGSFLTVRLGHWKQYRARNAW